MSLKSIAKDFLPPVVTRNLGRAKRLAERRLTLAPTNNAVKNAVESSEGTPHLDPYWDPEFAKVLETWGEGSTWNEIKLLLLNCRGKVLDVACGTGKVMEILKDLPSLDLHGTDISDFLIGKARQRGIPNDKLTIANAISLPYREGQFDYSYSIGSLEHFAEEDIEKFLAENQRITAKAAFHMVPCSRTDKNEGWIRQDQHYHNNSVAWWLPKFQRHYGKVMVCESRWGSDISVGKWFVCLKNWP